MRSSKRPLADGLASRPADQSPQDADATSIARDIGPGRPLEQELLRAQREFRQIFEHTSVGIYRASREGRILLANHAFAAMLGYASAAELKAVDLARDVYVDPHERERLIARYLPSGAPWTVEIQWKKRDGTPFWALINSHAIKDDAGRTLYFEGFAQDATERRRLETERDALSHRLIEIQETERRELANELHDEIGQQLAALKLLLEAQGRLGGPEAMMAIVLELSERVRDVSLRLRPPMLDELGLLPTLRWHLQRYTSRTGVRVRFSAAGLEQRFPGAVEMAAFRIVQEALTNVARHARVAEADVDVWDQSDWLNVRIEDHGVGFDASATVLPAARGLRGMRERVRLLGGTFTVETVPGGGVRVSVGLPRAPCPNGGAA